MVSALFLTPDTAAVRGLATTHNLSPNKEEWKSTLTGVAHVPRSLWEKWIEVVSSAYGGPYVFLKALQKAAAFVVEFLKQYRPDSSCTDPLKGANKVLMQGWTVTVLPYLFVEAANTKKAVDEALRTGGAKAWIKAGSAIAEAGASIGYALTLFTDCMQRTAGYTQSIFAKANILNVVHEASDLGVAMHDVRETNRLIHALNLRGLDVARSTILQPGFLAALQAKRTLHMMGVAKGVCGVAGFVLGVTAMSAAAPVAATGLSLVGSLVAINAAVYGAGLKYKKIS